MKPSGLPVANQAPHPAVSLLLQTPNPLQRWRGQERALGGWRDGSGGEVLAEEARGPELVRFPAPIGKMACLVVQTWGDRHRQITGEPSSLRDPV